MTFKKPTQVQASKLVTRADGALFASMFANLSLGQGGALVTTGHQQQVKSKGKGKRNVVREFGDYFGCARGLENWQRLCVDVGIYDDLTSITQCRKALKKVWVNIYDLLDAKKLGLVPRRFPNQAALAAYTVQTGKVFPKKAAKEGGPVRALLACIF